MSIPASEPVSQRFPPPVSSRSRNLIASRPPATDDLLFMDERNLHLETRRFLSDLSKHPLFGASPHAGLRTAFSPMLNVSGRRVRPLMPYWLWRARGADSRSESRIARVALATLLLHSAAIVIDDVEDGSRERAGLRPIHERSGEARTLNAASALVFAALEDLGEAALMSMAVDAVVRCHAGQALDLEATDPSVAAALFDATPEAREERYRTCAALKTSALMQLSLRGSAHVLGVETNESNRMIDAIGRYGVGYQILDDVKNFRPDLLGDKAYEDLPHGFKNWVCLDLISGFSEPRLEEAKRRYGTSQIAELFLEDPRLPEAIRRGIRTGESLLFGALSDLNQMSPDQSSREYLTTLLERPLDDLLRGLGDA
jgi:octaprenyl-diphosphate synthase